MDFVCAGRCFFLAAARADKRHLWVILTDPDGNPPTVATVMVRTATSFTDDTVVLNVGDHPFITRPSSVHYSTAECFSVTQILRMSKRGDCGIQPDIDATVLQRIQAGLVQSPYTVPRIREYCVARFKLP